MNIYKHQTILASALLLAATILVGMPGDALSLVTRNAVVSRPVSSLRASTSDIPSWKDIEKATGCLNHEPPIAEDGRAFSSSPNLSDGTRPTLYRERHGWCPYSERVWLALEAKGVEYDTIYIDNIYGRPSWYYGNTPQMKWEDGSTQSESMDLVRAIDERYEGESLYPEDILNEVINKGERAFRNIFPKRSRPSSRAAFLFRSDGSPLWKNEFEKTLSEADALLGETDGPFFCGDRFTSADIAWAPFLERYAGQLPCLHEGLDPKCPDTYPNLAAWYTAMETQVPVYACKVRGDPSSWRKVLTMAGFGNAGNVPDLVASRMDELSEAEKEPLTEAQEKAQQDLWDTYSATRPYIASSLSEEAAAVLVRNREAICRDVAKNCNVPSLSNDQETLEQAMRSLSVLLCGESTFSEAAIAACEENCGTEVRSLAAFLDERMCVPRDMGALSAACFKRL